SIRQDRDDVQNAVLVHVRDERGPEPGRVRGGKDVPGGERVSAPGGAAVVHPNDTAVDSHVKHFRVAVPFEVPERDLREGAGRKTRRRPAWKLRGGDVGGRKIYRDMRRERDVERVDR